MYIQLLFIGLYFHLVSNCCCNRAKTLRNIDKKKKWTQMFFNSAALMDQFKKKTAVGQEEGKHKYVKKTHK